jgi:ABC-type nitrate/sulfonate/bicarbonate transport system permease component
VSGLVFQICKAAIMLSLAVAWEASGSFLDNPLLFPTFHDTITTMFDKVKDGTIPLDADRRRTGVGRVVGAGWPRMVHLREPNLLDIPAVFAGLLTVIVIGLIVENLIFRTIERNTVQKWGSQS